MAFTYSGQSFETVWAARQVAAGAELSPSRCNWLVERVPEVTYGPDGEDYYWDDPQIPIVDCGAEVVETHRGWFCSAGHEHVSLEVQDREGWAYAMDAYDVAVISRGGKLAVPGAPSVAFDYAEVAAVSQAVFG